MDQEIELNIQNDEVEMELNTQDDGVGIDLENSETIVATNYNNLENKPKVNNVELSGNKTLDELGIQSKVAGKGLSSNDYTNEDKSKLDGIEENANNYVLPTDVVKDSNYVHTDNNYSTTDKNKLAGIESNANYYVLPTDVVKDNNYTHTDNNYTTNDKNKLAGIDMGSKQDTINDLDAIRSGASLGATALQSVPSEYAKKSDIPDVGSFITNTVNNLTNYYLKTETYTQTEVNNLIGQMQGISIEKVDALPMTGDIKKIYLVPSAATAEKNIYDEYIYFNNSWELIGSTKVDLSNYYTKTESDGRYLQSFTETDPTVPNWAKQSTKPTYTASEVGALPDTTTIPTKTSDLTNDSNFVTNTDYGTTSKAGVIKAANGANINSSTGTISAKTYTSDEYNTAGQYIFVGKGTLENVLAAKGYLTEHQDISGKQDKSTLETDVKTFINAEYIQTLFTNAEGVEF